MDVFENVLSKGNFDICHFHEYSEYGGIEIPWFKIAKEHTKKVFFTFHLPYLTCYKNDFRYYGIEDCGNFSIVERCVECIIATKINETTKLKLKNDALHLIAPLLKKISRADVLRKNIYSKSENLNQLIRTCDKVFVISNWFKEILINNGYNSPNLVRIPSVQFMSENKPGEYESTIKNKILFIGRIEEQKGLLLICEALTNNATIILDVYGNVVDEVYFKICKKHFNFNYKGVLSQHVLMTKLKEYDFVIVPSVAPEMSPMVVHESLNHFTPVIASGSKGNVELIQNGVNGFLFKYDDAKDLGATIDKAYGLKKEGWVPVFTGNANPGKAIKEILSFYNY